MAVTPTGPHTSRLTWSGEFVPSRMNDADAVVFWENIYRMGIGLMEATIARQPS